MSYQEKCKELEQQLKEARKHLAESVAKECKCEVNTSVNNDLVNRNLGLKQQLKESNEVVEFYALSCNWYNTDKDEFLEICDSDKRTPPNTTLICGGKKARNYLNKYKVKE
jgi:hypothetical protein